MRAGGREQISSLSRYFSSVIRPGCETMSCCAEITSSTSVELALRA
jgi:hypothetical protein